MCVVIESFSKFLILMVEKAITLIMHSSTDVKIKATYIWIILFLLLYFFLGRRIIFFHFKLNNFLGFFVYYILKFLKKRVKMFVNLFSISHSIHQMFNAGSKFLRGRWMRRMNPKMECRVRINLTIVALFCHSYVY